MEVPETYKDSSHQDKTSDTKPELNCSAEIELKEEAEVAGDLEEEVEENMDSTQNQHPILGSEQATENYKSKHSSNSEIPRAEKEYKLFVGGLTGDTSHEDLKNYFSSIVNVIDAFVVTDTTNKKPSGFGFVSVRTRDDMQKLIDMKHKLKGSILDCKEALNKHEAKEKETEERKRKLFVGGLPKNLKDDSLFEYFSTFGSIQKAYVVKDFKNGNTRGFGFVIFQTLDGYERVLRHSKPHIIYGKEIHVRETQSRREEKEKNKSKPTAVINEYSGEEEEYMQPNIPTHQHAEIEEEPNRAYYAVPPKFAQQYSPSAYYAQGASYVLPEGYVPISQPFYPTARPISLGYTTTGEELYYIAPSTSAARPQPIYPQAFYKIANGQYYQPIPASTVSHGYTGVKIAPVQYAAPYSAYGQGIPLQFEQGYRVIPTIPTYTIQRPGYDSASYPMHVVGQAMSQPVQHPAPSKKKSKSKHSGPIEQNSKVEMTNEFIQPPLETSKKQKTTVQAQNQFDADYYHNSSSLKKPSKKKNKQKRNSLQKERAYDEADAEADFADDQQS